MISDLAKNFLNNSLKEIMSAVNAESGSLFLCKAGQKELVLNSFYNDKNIHPEGLKQRISEGVSGKVVDIKEAVLVKDINSDRRFRKNGFRHYRTDSFISVPLFTPQGVFLGVIHLVDKSSGQPFSEKDLEIASTMTKYACITVESFLNCASIMQEKELMDKQNAFLEKYAALGKLAAGIVHEINNPLDGIIRYTNMVLNHMENDTVAQEYLLEAKKGLNRIANITKSLLEFSHQVNSVPAKEKKYVELNKVIDESLEALANRLNERIRIQKKFGRNIPRLLDFGISHVFINIIKNAFDAMPEGGLLKISVDLNDAELEINFRDTGFGIAPEIRDRIFEPFFTTKSIGTGLGLAMCNEIVSKYEGKIAVKSSPGKGSTFTILIPRKYLENA